MAPNWLLLIIVGGKGGIGKSLLATLLATIFGTFGNPPLLVQADMQKRLEELFPETITIDINALENIDDDQLALVRAFSPIPASMRICAANRRDQIVDVAATWHKPIIRYCAEIDLARQVAELGGKLVILCPTTADSDSLALTIETVQMVERLVSAAEIVFVRNNYPARVAFNVPELVKLFGKSELKRILEAHHHMTIPAINPSIWGKFERAGLNPAEVIDAEAASLMSIADADVDTVHVMQGRVERWLNEFQAQAEIIAKLRHA